MNGLLRSCESISSISKIQTWTRPLQLHTIVWYYNLMISETYIDIFICCSNTEFWLVAYIYSTYMVRAFMFSQFFFFFFFTNFSNINNFGKILHAVCSPETWKTMRNLNLIQVSIWWISCTFLLVWNMMWNFMPLYLRKSFLNPCVTSWE